MKLNDLIPSGAVKLPWPTLVNGKKAEKTTIGESETCKIKCRTTPLCGADANIGEHSCTFGMSYFVYRLTENHITVYGLRGPANITKLNTYTKAGLKGRSVTHGEIDEWIGSLRLLLERIEQLFILRQSEMLDPLHDPMRIAKQINTIANRMAQEASYGSTFDEKIQNASTELKTLVKASDLLSDSFDLLTIYFNPDAASFGRQLPISLHGLLTKLVAIFRIDDGGFTRSTARIYLEGSCYRNVFAHESFKLIPFALLSNAVKYSMMGNIQVTITDRQPLIEVGVQSVGPYIEEEERARIFEKRGRGKWASKLHEGKGVGLYLAAIIAKAHSFDIKVTSRKTGEYRDEIPIATNRFYFEIAP